MRLACSWAALAGLLASGLTSGLTSGAAARAADDAQVVDAYLQRLGLVDLQMRFHEQALDRAPPGPARLPVARRLADLYAAALLATEDAARGDGLRRRIERLLEREPEAGGGALQVSLDQADYQRAEKLALAWLEDPRDLASRDAAAQGLEKVLPRLEEHRDAFTRSADSLAEQAERAAGEASRNELDERSRRDQALAARAAYLAAWGRYYAGLCVQPAPSAATHFQAARRSFRQALGLTDEDVDAELDPETLGLEPLARARAAVGLGLSEAALDRPADADRVFTWLQGASVNPQVRDLADYWRLQSRLYVRRWSDAVAIARERTPSFAPPAVASQVSFCAALVRAAYGTPSAEAFGEAPKADERVPDEATRRTLADLGLQGLLRLRQLNLVRELATKYSIPVAANSPLPLVWARGDQWFREAETSKSADAYRKAADLLSAALARPEAAADVGSAGRCRWTLAWCRYRLEDYEAAGELFRQASSALREADAKTASEAAWMAFASYQHRLTERPALRAAAVEVLEQLRRDFPDSPRARQAGLQLARLQQNSASPADALRTLEKIPPSDPQYPAARLEICRLEHAAWKQAQTSGGAADPTRLLSAVDACKKAIGDPRSLDDVERLLKSVLLAADALALDATDAGAARLAAELDGVERFAERLPPSSPALVEYRYRRFQLAQRRRDDAAAQREADWISRHGAGSPYELPALVQAAREIDRRIDEAAEAERPALQTEAARIYARLVAHWGDSPAVLREKKNALIAGSKLAHYEFETGKYVEAARRLGRLLEAYPQDKALLRRAANAERRAGQTALALTRWRTLLAGLEKGSYDWFEAKYGQLECLAELEPPKAAEALAQFRLLYPDLGPPELRPKFQQLERRLAGAAASPR